MRRVLGPALGFRVKHAAAPAPSPEPQGPRDQVAEVVSINDDDSVTFRVPPYVHGEAPLAEITVVYATVTPPADAGPDWFLDPSKGFPNGTAVPALSGSEVVVRVEGVALGISFVQVIWGYAA